jgi:hypothetical protein
LRMPLVAVAVFGTTPSHPLKFKYVHRLRLRPSAWRICQSWKAEST